MYRCLSKVPHDIWGIDGGMEGPTDGLLCKEVVGMLLSYSIILGFQYMY